MNFLKAIEFVDNFKSDSVVVGLNKFADLSKAEFRAFNLGRLDTPLIEDNLREKPTRSEFYKSHVKTEKLGESFSYMTWNGTIYDPPVLDQGRCGSCWAFAAAEALSSFQTVNNPNLGMIVLSPQQITDCAFLGIHDGCNGGDFNRATTWTANHGITTDKAYPYISGVTEKSGTCDQSVKPIYYPNKGHMTLPRNYTDFANIMTAGPVKVSI
jgi:cathepsin L